MRAWQAKRWPSLQPKPANVVDSKVEGGANFPVITFTMHTPHFAAVHPKGITKPKSSMASNKEVPFATSTPTSPAMPTLLMTEPLLIGPPLFLHLAI
jgi:hypothetical protein